MNQHVSTVNVSLIGIGLLSVIGLGIALMLAAGVIAIAVLGVFGVFLLGLGLSRLFRPTRSFVMGVLGGGYAVMLFFDVIVYRGGTSVLLAGLLVALAIGYALYRRAL